jgi:hypothetical protein
VANANWTTFASSPALLRASLAVLLLGCVYMFGHGFIESINLTLR